jgi:Tol biopolymer transport system component
LQIRAIAQSDRGYSDDVYTVNINGNALTSAHQLYGNSANVLSANDSDKRVIWGAGGTVSNVFGSFVIDILDPYESKNKTIRVLSGYHQSDARHIMLASGFWNNTASVTSLEIDPIYGSNFKQYSRFSLYGIRGV